MGLGLLSSLIFILCGSLSFAPPIEASQRYKKSEISDARFGTGDRARLLERAQNLSQILKSKIVGQDVAIDSLQQRLVQYLENFPNRKHEPVSLHMIGLPGVGKSAMVAVLRELGFKVFHFDAQKYASLVSTNFSHEVTNALYSSVMDKSPVILVVEELDKVKEVTTDLTGRDDSSPLIGTLNQILSDGILSNNGQTLEMSNVFVLTTMNFSPEHISEFSAEAFEKEKSFYDFTLEDLKQFISWVRDSAGARYKILSKLFRTNTVGRIAPNTIIMEPILEESYRLIAELKVQETIQRSVSGRNSAKRLQVSVDPSFIEFLVKEAVYPPSGARETVFRTDALTEQLINYGAKSIDPSNPIPDVPRKIRIEYDSENQGANITITPLIQRGKNLSEGDTFQVLSSYNFDSKMFSEPRFIARSKPFYPLAEKKTTQPRITKKIVRETRFPKSKDLAKGLDNAINNRLVGQSKMAAIIKDDLNRYLSRPGPAKKEPSFRALSGFPGIGKSEMVKVVAEHLNLPVIRVNMQQFSSDAPETVMGFFETITDLLRLNQEHISNGQPYILLLEELDKVYEIDPMGALTNRPIMGVIKDLLNDGYANFSNPVNGARRTIDIRSAFTFITMNFSVDRFGFEADPRLTTVDDVIGAWKKLSTTPMATKSLLGSMFLPETVSRLMSRFSIVKPLNRVEYIQLVKAQIQQTVNQRLLDSEGRNSALVEIEATPKYLQYLFNETVIPSEGARNTVVYAGGLIGSDLEDTLSQLPRGSKYATEPLIVTLDFLYSKKTVVVKVRLADENPKDAVVILEKPVALNFPPLSASGKLSEERILVSAHEFGHAFINAKLGLRFESIAVVSPKPGIGGYVKLAGSRFSALEMMGNIYSLLGARAFERLTLNKDPLADTSVLHVTSGASSDIQQATKTLYRMIYELGFDPWGGIIDRNLTIGMEKYANIASASPEIATKLGLILREMEDRIVEDLLQTQNSQWYIQRIQKLAKKGFMSEEEFYKLINYEYPGENENRKNNFGATSNLRRLFSRHITPVTENKKAIEGVRGDEKLTVEQTIEKYMGWFTDSIRKHLHEDGADTGQKPCEDLLK